MLANIVWKTVRGAFAPAFSPVRPSRIRLTAFSYRCTCRLHVTGTVLRLLHFLQG